jgi:hypothetical protein
MQTIDWQVFLDESGDFSKRSERVVLAGLVVEHIPGHEWATWLRNQLRLIYPFYENSSYPPHATHLHCPLAQAAYAALLPNRRSEPEGRFFLCCEPVLSALRGTNLPEAKDFFSEIQKKRMPSVGVLWACDRWLSKNNAKAHSILKNEQHSQQRGIEALFSAMARQWRCFLIAATESDPPDNQQDRYLRLTEVLGERLTALLHHQKNKKTVWVYTEQKLVLDPKLNITLPLRKSLLQETFRASQSLRIFASRQVRLEPATPSSKSPQMPPGLILADLIVHRLRRILSEQHQWNNLREQAQKSLCLPLEAVAETFPGRLPSLAVDGNPRQALNAALDGTFAVKLETTHEPQWSFQQAEPWLDAIEQGEKL